MTFTVYMTPVAKSRSRVDTRPGKGGKLHSYTPQKTLDAEGEIWATYLKQSGTFLGFDMPTPVRIEATFYLPRPKHLSKKKISQPVKRPDLSNYLKLLEDALHELPWDDDSQITTALVKKRYGDPPRIEVTIEEDI